MRGLEEIKEPEVALAPVSLSSPVKGGNYGSTVSDWRLTHCNGFWYDVTLMVPSVIFVVYLAFQARKSFRKLSHDRSYIIIAYYGLLWLVSVLNLAWCALQEWECTPGKDLSWNLLSLFTTSGILFLEVSLLAFLLLGNYASGVEALARTFIVSGIIVGVDILLRAIYLFGFGVPVFIDYDETINRVKWGLWVVHKLLLTTVYGFVIFVHHSKWRDRLPARPAFYNYVTMMFCLNAIALFACVHIASGAGLGLGLYNLTTICYHAFYLPLLYVTFLADFFQEDDLSLENVYYSEMKVAGFFDADWE